MELAFEIDVETSGVITRGDGESASIDVDPRGRLLAVALGSWAGIVRAETFETAVPLAGVSEKAKVVRSIRFVDGGTQVAAFVKSGDRGALRFWNVEDGSEVDRAEERVGALLAADPAGTRLVMLSDTHSQLSCRLWNVADRREERELETPYLRDKLAASFRPDGAAVAVTEAGKDAAQYPTTKVWHLDDERFHPFDVIGASAPGFLPDTGRDVSRLVGHHRDEPALHTLTALPNRTAERKALPVHSRDGLVCASANAAAYFPTKEAAVLVRLSDERALAFATPREVKEARFTPDGRRLICVGAQGLIRAWNVDLSDRVQVADRS